MGKRKTINAEMRKGCAGLFAATLCCVGTALPAFAADTDPAPDPVPTVTEKPDPKPDPQPEPKPDPEPEPKPDPNPDPKPEPKPTKTTPTTPTKPAGNTSGKSVSVGVKKPVSKARNYSSSRSSKRFIQTQNVSSQGELAKTGALAMTGGLCALVLVVGGGGTILVRKLRKNTPEKLTSTPGVGSDK